MLHWCSQRLKKSRKMKTHSKVRATLAQFLERRPVGSSAAQGAETTSEDRPAEVNHGGLNQVIALSRIHITGHKIHILIHPFFRNLQRRRFLSLEDGLRNAIRNQI